MYLFFLFYINPIYIHCNINYTFYTAMVIMEFTCFIYFIGVVKLH